MTGSLATRSYPAGWPSYSVFNTRYPPTSFNPNTGGDPGELHLGGRFHPFDGPTGLRVATKYLADHPNGAFAETLLRDDAGQRTVSIADIERHGLVLLRFARDVVVADLTPENAGVTVGELLGTGRASYPALRTIARSLHERYPRLDGLVWRGYQVGTSGMNCMVLFGDRVDAAADLDASIPQALHAGIGLDLLRDAARERQFALPDRFVLDGPRASAD